MTPEERAHHAVGDWIMGKLDMGELERLVAAAIREAIKAEREACAVFVFEMGDQWGRLASNRFIWADEAAAAIRART